MTIAPDFREFAASLNAREVRYVIVGGYAVAFHGHPRYTKELDVWVDRSSEYVERLLLALKNFGFGAVGLTAEDFLPANQLIQLGDPPLRIDLLTSVDGVDFDECFVTRDVFEVDGVKLPFIRLEELRKNKRSSGRAQDLADLENLE